MRRVLRWTLRIALGVVALIVLAIVATIVIVHTDRGREVMRARIEAELRSLFPGGAHLGKLEGSPFGELVVRDLVIDGPDRKPAISVGVLRVRVRLFDLVREDLRVDELAADDVEVAVKRDANGALELARLVKPLPETKSSWNLDLASIEIHHAHVMIDTGTADAGLVNLDELAISAHGDLLASGESSARLRATATWHERRAPIAIDAVLDTDAGVISVPSFAVHAGDVAVSASNVLVTRRDGRVPLVSGVVDVVAPRRAVAALVPRIVLPADLHLRVDAAPCAADETAVAIAGSIGPTPIHADLTGNLAAKHLFGTISTGELDLAALTRGTLVATAGGRVIVDVTAGRAGELPTAMVNVDGHGTLRGSPRGDFTIAAETGGQHVRAVIGLTGPARARIEADVDRVAGDYELRRARVEGSLRAREPKLRGAVEVALTAHGRLAPAPDLAVAGTIKGTGVRVAGLSIASLDASLDARQVPAAPHGTANVRIAGLALAHRDVRIDALTIDVADRAGGKLAVDVASRAVQDRWLVELAALVTPPSRTDPTTVVELRRDRVRVGKTEWTGSSGRISIGPRGVEVRDVRTRSADGKIALSGTYTRAGDLMAKLDAEQFPLETLRNGYFGTLEAHLDVARRAGRWSGDVGIRGKRIALLPRPELTLTGQGRYVDLDAKLSARPEHVSVAIAGSDSRLGKVDLALELAAPARLEDVAAWNLRGRDAIERGSLHVSGLDLAGIAALVAPDVGPAGRSEFAPLHSGLAGHVDGTLELSTTTATGSLRVRGLHTSIAGVPPLDADLELAQASADELAATLGLDVSTIGHATARVELHLPHRVFDPAAWRRLGPSVVRSASIRTGTITVDPALLQRFQLASAVRGRAKLAVDIGPALGSIALTATADDVRTPGIAKPIALRVDAAYDGRAATAKVAVSTPGRAGPLVELDGRVPVTIAELRAGRARTLPIDATLALAKTPTATLLELLGRAEVTQGTLDGKVTIGGTIGEPTVTAHVIGEDLGVPAGTLSTPVKRVTRLVVDAAWNPRGAKLTVTGTEPGGTLSLVAEGKPSDLASATARLDASGFDLAPLFVFAPGPAGGARGTIDAKLAIAGFDPRTAKLAGELRVRSAHLPIAPEIGTLRDADLELAIHAHDIAIAATGKLGAGDVKLQGTIALDGVSLAGGSVKLTLRKVSPIGAVEPTIDADVVANIARKDATWTVDVSVDHGLVKVAKKSGEQLKPVDPPSDLAIGQRTRVRRAGPPAVPTRPIVVANVALHGIRVETDEVRTTLQGKVKITADASAVGVVGQITAQRGDIDLFARRYRVERATVSFDGTTDPVLDLQISHDFTDVTTVTAVHGRLSAPKLELSSNPPSYSQSELLGFLLGGEPAGAPTSGSARDKVGDAGTSIIANQIGGYVKKALPFDVDVIRYEAATVTSSSAITVGSWVTRTMFVAFREHIDARPDENSGEATIEYWLSHRLELEGTAGDRGYDTFDVLWRKRF